MADRVILTGFMGSGKSAVGRILARESGMDFIDTDNLAEAKMGMSITEAFESKGEQFFRAAEEAVIRESLEGPVSQRGTVIALGGGSITSAGVRQLLAAEPAVVMLDVDTATAFDRVHDKSRPLARDRREFMSLFGERKTLYHAVAKLTIDTRGKSVDEIVLEIRNFLARRTK